MAKTHKQQGMRLCGGLLAICFLLAGCGTMGLQPSIHAEVMMTAGIEVRLHYAGPQEAKNMFCINEIVSVYEKRGGDYVEVGKVKVLRELDRNNLAALVVDGSMKDGDEARKSIAACKIRPLLPQSP